MARTAGIILAAGESKRFGQPKQLIQLQGKYILEWVLKAALTSRLEKVILVLGHDYLKIKEKVDNAGHTEKLLIVYNRDYRQGQSSSLRSGLSEIRGIFPQVMVLLGDQPLVTRDVIDMMLERFQQSDKTIGVPFYKGKRGNPVIFSQVFYDALMTIEGDMGARDIIKRHPSKVLKIEIDDPTVFFDIDSPEDLKRMKSFLWI
jgi:molybdenum cofactor cytidylyltransferase